MPDATSTFPHPRPGPSVASAFELQAGLLSWAGPSSWPVFRYLQLSKGRLLPCSLLRPKNIPPSATVMLVRTSYQTTLLTPFPINRHPSPLFPFMTNSLKELSVLCDHSFAWVHPRLSTPLRSEGSVTA